jgi:hypothetical protein
MTTKKKLKKQKEIIFSEEIDDKINGFSLALTFIVVGVLLIYDSSYFGHETVGTIFRWTFIVIGLIGLSVELSKALKKIKGAGNFILGVVFITIWLVLYLTFSSWIANILSLVFLIGGSYGTFRGLFEIIYSVRQLIKSEKKSSVVTDVFLLITNILGLALVAIQILQQLEILPM